jgi:CheY-like chemotaxis protein
MKTLLVVEDNEGVREGLVLLLRRDGYAVEAVGDGWQALERLRNGSPPDLILLDMMTPVLDGWRFLERRRQEAPLAAVPVIITTALGVASPEWAASLGAADCLRKPFEVEDLVQAVRRCCGEADPPFPGPGAHC